MEYFAATVDDDVMQRGRCSEITEGKLLAAASIRFFNPVYLLLQIYNN